MEITTTSERSRIKINNGRIQIQEEEDWFCPLFRIEIKDMFIRLLWNNATNSYWIIGSDEPFKKPIKPDQISEKQWKQYLKTRIETWKLLYQSFDKRFKSKIDLLARGEK